MKTTRHPIFQSLKTAFQIAQQLHQNPHLTYDDLIEKNEKTALNRRQFLKSSTVLGLSTLGIGHFLENTTPFIPSGSFSEKSNPKIAIVGAGIAGLTAGFYLKTNGIKATLFEADKRVGGRIKSAKIFGNGTLTTEIGAEFIDTVNIDMIRLAQMLGLWDNRIDVNEDKFGIKDAFYLDGQHRTLKEVVGEISQIIKPMIADRNALGNNYQTARAKALDHQSMMEYVENMPLSRWMKNGLYSVYLGEQGLESYDISSINLIEVLDIDKKNNEVKFFGESDERYKIKGGNQQITEGLAEKLKDQIQLEHRLIAIKEKANRSLVLTFENNGKIVEETFDAVILCMPFTILRGVYFDMALPASKQLVINELAYGSNTKFVMEFKERVWRQSNYQGYLFNNDIHNGWDSTQQQTGNKGVGTYTVFLGGADAKNAARGSENTMSEQYLPILEAAFKGAKDNFTMKTELANWANNPFVKASYSSFGIGQYTTLSGKAAESVRNLHFAGEHCSAEFWGFMNGGAETGRKAAEKILRKVRR